MSGLLKIWFCQFAQSAPLFVSRSAIAPKMKVHLRAKSDWAISKSDMPSSAKYSLEVCFKLLYRGVSIGTRGLLCTDRDSVMGFRLGWFNVTLVSGVLKGASAAVSGTWRPMCLAWKPLGREKGINRGLRYQILYQFYNFWIALGCTLHCDWLLCQTSISTLGHHGATQ